MSRDQLGCQPAMLTRYQSFLSALMSKSILSVLEDAIRYYRVLQTGKGTWASKTLQDLDEDNPNPVR